MPIKPMQFDDLDAVLSIEKEVQISPWSKSAFISSLRDLHICVVFWEDESIIGFAIMMDVADQAEILNIAVKHTRQHHGFGKKLMSYLLEYVKQTPNKKVFLEVRESNAAAIRLYTSFGFKKIFRRKNYYQTKTGREDALVLEWRAL